MSTLIDLSGVPGFKSIYSSARSAAPRSSALAKSDGFGTAALNGNPCPGLVPQVTNGANSSAFRSTSLSNFASASVVNVFQYATAASHSAPVGACGFPLT